jgi:putative ATP-dependent endonuclease of the OLD family
LVEKPVAVVADNDGDFDKNITKKYQSYSEIQFIKIFVDKRPLLPTLELQIVDANKDNLKLLCEILSINETKFNTIELISKYMIANKTESALKIFNSAKSIKFPNYINDVVDWCNEK